MYKRQAKEAAESWMDAMADEGLEIPAPSAMDDVVKNPDYKGGAARPGD